nr:MAG TPA: hypothetical protein [Caudoviricetes sp.]
MLPRRLDYITIHYFIKALGSFILRYHLALIPFGIVVEL